MKAHTSEFKEQIKTLGRELDSIVSFNNTELGGEQLNSVIPHYEGGLLKSVMKQLDIDSNVEINVGDVVNYKLGIKVNDEYEYLNFGNYIVNKVEKQEDFNSYMITCYDKMLYSMKDYEKLNISYPISVRDYITAICNHLGINFKNKNETFANYDKMIQNELYLDENDNSLGYTFRDVFDELAQATASTICINDNDELEIRYINDTQDTIDEEFLRDVNINFGKKYGKVNSIVLSRSSGSDNVYLRDEASVSENGLTELKISDNQIMNWNDRSDYLPDILEKINGLEYYLNDFVSTGVCYYDLCDKYNVKIGDNIYPCIMLNDEINITQGLFEEVFTEELEISETDYTKSDKTDRKINQTYLIVDKQNGVIQGVVEKTEQIEQDITTTKQSNGYPITIEDAGAYPLDSIEIEGKSYQEVSVVKDGDNIFDFAKWYKNRNSIRQSATWDETSFSFDNTGTSEVITVTPPMNNNDLSNNKAFINIAGFEIESSTDYTFSCSNPNLVKTEILIFFYDKDYKYLSLLQGLGGSNSRLKTSFTTPSNAKYICFRFDNEAKNVAPTNLKITEITLKKGADSTYTPFVSNSPSPDYPSEIKSVEGVTNLFDKDNANILNCTTDTTNNVIVANDGLKTLYIKVKPNTTYTIQKKVENTFRITTTTEEPVIGGAIINSVVNHSADTITLTTESNANYLLVTYYNIRNYALTEQEILDSIMIEEGSIAHPFVPFGRWLEQKTIGKNLFNGNLLEIAVYDLGTNGVVPSKITSTTRCALSPANAIKVKTNTTYTITIPSNCQVSIGELAEDKTLIKQSNWQTTITYKFTTSATTEYLCMNFIYGNNQTITNDILSMFTNSTQLEEGTATPYEPYKESTALIDLNKKNLANINDIQVGKQWNDITNTTRASIIFIPVKPNTQYTLSGDISSNSNLTTLRIVETNSEKTSSYVKSAGTFTTYEQTSYVSIEILSSTTITSEMLKDVWVKLYEGVETDDYYRLASIGDVKDTFKYGVLTQRIGKVVLDGSESWDYSPTNGFNRFILSANEFIGKINSTPISTHFIGGRTDNKYNEIYLGGSGRLAILYNTTSSSEFKNWLSENPVEVYYELATPIEHKLNYQILELHEGYNNITLNDELEPNMSVVYLTDSTMNSTYATKAEVKAESDAINLRVDAKIDDKDLTSAEIIARINKDTGTSEAKIKADSISLEGLTTVNDNFQIDEKGNMKAVDGTFEGHVTAISGSIGEWQIDEDGNLYADREINGIIYRTYIQQANAEDGGNTWAFSTQVSTDGGDSFTGTAIIKSDGNISTNKNITAYENVIAYEDITAYEDLKTSGHLIVNGDLQFANDRLIPVQYVSYNSGNVQVANEVDTALAGLELGAGRFIIVTQFSFSANSLGMRRVNVSTTEGSGEANIQQAPSPKGVTRIRHVHLLNLTKDTMVWWNCHQTSGSTLSCNATAWIYRIQ